MNVMIGSARLEFFLLFNDRRRRRHHHLFHFVNAGPFFPALFFQNEPMALRNLGGDVRLDRLIDVGKNVEAHQLGNQLMRFQSKLCRQLLHNDRRLDVNDIFRLGFLFFGRNSRRRFRFGNRFRWG